MQAQAWICPLCFDDHGGRDCKPEDLKAELEKARARAEAAESALAEVLALHQPRECRVMFVRRTPEPSFGTEDGAWCDTCDVRYPCPTVAALATPTTPEETR